MHAGTILIAVTLAALVSTADAAAARPRNQFLRSSLAQQFRQAAVAAAQEDISTTTTHPAPPAPPTTPPAVCALPSNAITAPKENLFREFEIHELRGIKNWLFAQKDLNLTEYDNATLASNYVWKIERVLPKKQEALAYYDTNGRKPSRWAEVTLHYGSVPEVRQYLVGPLPTGKSTTARLVKTFPFNARNIDAKEYDAMYQSVADLVGTPFAESGFSQDVLGGINLNADNDTLSWIDTATLTGSNASMRATWVYWVSPKEGQYIRPTGLHTLFDHPGNDVSTWKVLMHVYEQQVFKTTEDLLAAWRSKTLQTPNKYQDEPDTLSGMKPQGTPRKFDDRPGPRSALLAGPRFTVDPSQRYVEWMDWQFYLRFDRDTGVGLFDVRFKGDRIAYEVGLTEALAQYSGSNPSQANTAYLDTHYGIGNGMFELLDGWDCPYGSTYFDLDYYEAGKASTNFNNVCVFEVDSGLSIGRHWGELGEGTYYGFGTTKGYQLHVRAVATVFNYDYIFDYVFWLDGTFEIKVAASGYMQGTWWTPADELKYGGRIGQYSMGSVHDHILNFKLDLDILGTANSFETTEIGVEEVTFPWLLEGQKLVQKKLDHVIAQTEFGLETMPPNALGSHWKFINPAKKNRWGNSRGYRIMAANPMKNIVQGNTLSLKNANWAKYFIAVTKRKDEEQSASDNYNYYLPTNPPLDFDSYLNGESIVNEDLVAWVNLGNHHVPRAEDAPVTLTSASRGSIMVTPFHYFDEMATRDIINSAYLTPNEKPNKPAIAESFGLQEVSCCPSFLATPYLGTPRGYKDV
ncbi:hypothetical protein HDU96_000412 [Phlyctochytrium bullatum]|nr:hypothetical protein HDU96_000412 [Phlyctochytrium bullatum]